MTKIKSIRRPVTHVPVTGVLGLDNEYNRAYKDVIKTVPTSHNRIVKERTEKSYKERVLKTCYGSDDIKVGDRVFYVHKVNLGTKKWPYIVNSIEHDVIKSIGNVCVVMQHGDRPNFDMVLCIAKNP